MNPLRLCVQLAVVASLAGCNVGPRYSSPTPTAPQAWKGAAGELSPDLPEDWWTLFHDAQLDALEALALSTNQDLSASLARVEQARAAARIVGSDLFPQIRGDAGLHRDRFSDNRPVAPGARQSGYTSSTYSAAFDLAFEIDLWGRVRRAVESAEANASATELDRIGLRLTIAGDVARTYFAIRTSDAESRVLAEAVDLRRRAVEILKGRFESGVGNEVDLSRAQTELATAEADIRTLQRQRAAYENALAVLCGQAAPNFTVDASESDGVAVDVPAGLPSEMLKRRPDIAGAIQRLREANARIGVELAEYYPRFSLTGSFGVISGDLGSVFNASSRAWSIGPSVSVPIFEGGRIDARVEQARALYREREAMYRQTLLIAFREVEDSLSALTFLRDEVQFESQAQQAADRTFELTSGRYQRGLISYLEVVDAARSQLDARRTRVRLHGVQLEQTILLMKALGGGWKSSDQTTS